MENCLPAWEKAGPGRIAEGIQHMTECSHDIVILTDARYVDPPVQNAYIRNVLMEDGLVHQALEKRGFRVHRAAWDDPEMDWNDTRFVLFRSTWDYFERFPEFSPWLDAIRGRTRMINPESIIDWNLDKNYLKDLENNGIKIPPTVIIEQGDTAPLSQWFSESGWNDAILKPVVSGGARHTYKLNTANLEHHEQVYHELIQSESMMLQEFQYSIPVEGEVAHMVFGGKYSHSVLKKARPGDFRVQDDFGGSVHAYHASPSEIELAEQTVKCCKPVPVYARVDVLWDNRKQPAVSELELIEPELWFRMHPPAVEAMADAVASYIRSFR